MSLRARLFEKTAIYKAKVQQYNRVVVPDEEIQTLGLSSEDNIRVVMYQIEDVNTLSRDRVSFIASMQKSGRFTVPNKVRDVHDIEPGKRYQVIVRKTDS